MEPLFKYTDSQVSLKVLIIITGIGLTALGFAPLPGDPPQPIVWFTRSMILLGPMIALLTPQVRLMAFSDHLEITYGLTRLTSFRLSNEKITDIRAVTYNPIKDFGGWGIKGGGGEWRGWLAFTATTTNVGLAIETTEKNYLLGCPNPEDAVMALRPIVGLK